MKRLFPITITLFALSLTGCGDESDPSPADGRDFDAEGYVAPGPYKGRLIDGYLRNARVWLDLDGDGQYTDGPMTIQNEAGDDIVIPSGEPTTMSGEDGRFSLDVSELLQDPLVSPDLDPRDYALIALILPGTTIEQTSSGDVVLNEAYMLTAPPGIRNVTPLTTLLRQRRVNGISELAAGDTELAVALGNVNLVSDYILAEDHRAHAYAQAFARFLALQFPDAYEDILRTGDGTERFLGVEAIRLMGISFAANALEVVQLVDDAAAGDYQSVDVASLDIPVVEIELEDTLLVDRQVVRSRGEGGSLPVSQAQLGIAAELEFDYSEDARLTSISVNGCMKPSLHEMVRLINEDGKISDTGTQWVPTVSLSDQSATFYDQEGADERLTFDWENRTATFETTTTCHPGLAASSELGGPAAIEYEWTRSGGRLATITATSSGKTETLTPNYSFSTDFFLGYTRNVNGDDREILALSAASECSTGEPEETPHVVTSIQPYAVSGSIPQPASFNSLELEMDTRDVFNRPLRYGFLDEEFTSALGESSPVDFEWSFFYPTKTSNSFDEGQPNLIQTAFLANFRGDLPCGRNFGTNPGSLYARVDYSYQLLSEYLAGQIE